MQGDLELYEKAGQANYEEQACNKHFSIALFLPSSFCLDPTLTFLNDAIWSESDRKKQTLLIVVFYCMEILTKKLILCFYSNFY